MLAMCLAKTGSTARWAAIADDLGLPASHATRIGGLLRYVRRTGLWPEVLASLERLMGLLQQHPPPVDYTRRRAQADQADAFVDAIDAALRVHPSPRPRLMLTRQLWERFTGGDIAYAPEPLRLDPNSPSYASYRCHLPVRDADLLHVAYRHLQQRYPISGPVAWTPRVHSADLDALPGFGQANLEDASWTTDQ